MWTEDWTEVLNVMNIGLNVVVENALNNASIITVARQDVSLSTLGPGQTACFLTQMQDRTWTQCCPVLHRTWTQFCPVLHSQLHQCVQGQNLNTVLSGAAQNLNTVLSGAAFTAASLRAGTEPERSAVRFSIHSWITAVSTHASHKRVSSTFGNGDCRHPTSPLPPKRHTMQEKQYLEVTPCQRQC
jgi:hypothetical protein